jgi:Mlc titration factor MtfA (ptsG expression regulator)
MIGFIITLSAVGIGIFLAKSMPKRKPGNKGVSEDVIEETLRSKVAYYQSLSTDDQLRFRKEVLEFLEEITISGVNTDVSDEDEVLVAASAIIPIFSFPGWKYPNLHEVLLYPDFFDEKFSLDAENEERHVMGMVGSGAMNHVMILSLPALQEGFSNKTDKNNTAIHEFVHLIDKTDGEVDGVPELLTGHEYTKPWLQLIQQKIAAI